MTCQAEAAEFDAAAMANPDLTRSRIRTHVPLLRGRFTVNELSAAEESCSSFSVFNTKPVSAVTTAPLLISIAGSEDEDEMGPKRRNHRYRLISDLYAPKTAPKKKEGDAAGRQKRGNESWFWCLSLTLVKHFASLFEWILYIRVEWTKCFRINLLKLGSSENRSGYEHKYKELMLSLIHIWRCRRSTLCRSRWSPYH